MRISDWSSDVCSSDLAGLAVHQGVDGVDELQVLVQQHAADQRALLPARQADGRRRLHHPAAGFHVPVGRKDRQGVVEGKSGSERVDLGGGRIIKKKTRMYDQYDIKT